MKPATPPSPSRPPRRWIRGIMVAWALALFAWLGIVEHRARPESVAARLQALIAAEPRFAGATVSVKSDPPLSVLVPEGFSPEATADLERLIARQAGSLKYEITYLRPGVQSPLPPPTPLPGDTFLGLRDSESRKVGDTHPESAVGFVTDLTTVSERDYADYQRVLAAGEVKAHGTRDGYLYYATEVGRDVPFPNGSSAWVFITERYKTRLPAQ